MKKLIFIFVIICLVSVNVWATEDFSMIEADNFFGSPKDIIDSILNNELSFNGKSIFENILELLNISIKNILPHIASLFGITIILSLIEKLKLLNVSGENACLTGGRIIFSVMLVTSSMSFVLASKEALLNISDFTNALLPLIITLLASLGVQGTATSAGPSQALLSSILINICVNVIFPLIITGFTVSVINGILGDNKLKGISEFMKNSASWIMGGVFTVFSAILAIQGAVSGITDGLSLKSIKYALSSSVPIIGSTISENFSAVLLSAFSIKSAAGIMGIIVISGIIIVPIINIWAYVFALNMFGAVVQPFAGSFIFEQIKNITAFLKLAMIVLLGTSVLWFIFLGIIVSSGGNLI